MADESSSEGAGWSLAEAVNGTDSHGLRAIRELTASELDELKEDSKLIVQLATGLGWQDVIDNWGRFEGIVNGIVQSQSDKQLTAPERDALQASCVSLLLALASFAEKLEEAESYLNEGVEVASLYHQACHFMGWPDVAAILRATLWAQLSEPLLEAVRVDDAPGRASWSVALTSAGRQAFNRDEPRTDVQLIIRLVQIADRAISCYLGAMESKIRATALRLRSQTVEVLVGRPVLLKIDPEELAKGGSSLGIEEIRVDLIGGLLRAASEGASTLRDFKKITDNDEQEARTQRARGRAETQVPAHPEGAPDEGLSDREDADDTDSGQSFDFPWSVSDVSTFLVELAHLSEQMEKRWSSALEFTLTDDDVEAERSRWFGLMQSILEITQRRDAADKKLGLETKLDQFPVPVELAAKFALNAEKDELYVQQLTGFTYAVAHLADSLAVLQKPANKTVSLPAGDIRWWWSSGGFAYVRTAAAFASRCLDEVDETRQLFETSDRGPETVTAHSSLGLVFGRTSLAIQALNAGLPEAALIYALRADSAVRELGMVGPLPEDFRRQVQTITEALAAGEAVPIGVATVNAHLAVERLRTQGLRPGAQDA